MQNAATPSRPEPDRSGWRSYRTVWLRDLAAMGLRTAAGTPLVTRQPCLPNVDVAVPMVSFGQTRRPDGRITEYPEPGWLQPAFEVHNGHAYTLHDAVVHGELGLVTVGDLLVRDTLHLTLPDYHGFKWIGENEILVSPANPKQYIDNATHLICGYVGNRNYAHWITDIVPALFLPSFPTMSDGSTLLFSIARRPWQQQTLDLLPETVGRTMFLDGAQHVSCGSLTIVPYIKASGWLPHPVRRIMAAELSRRVGAAGPAKRRIYVSRRDAGARRMVNEEEIEALVRRHDFEVVTLTGMDVAEQIRLFHGASHVISAHGAGLANVVFCQPGSVLCELFMDSFVQWAFRRLSSVVPMTYGCLVGQTQDWEMPSHARTWILPPEMVEAALTAPPLRRL